MDVNEVGKVLRLPCNFCQRQMVHMNYPNEPVNFLVVINEARVHHSGPLTVLQAQLMAVNMQ